MPYWLSRAVGKGLAENHDDRYADMDQLLRALTDEPPDDDLLDEPGDDDPVEHEGRLLNAPTALAGAAPQRERWTYLVMGSSRPWSR